MLWAQAAPEDLEIANPNPVGSGARALGQGNAFIAVADDATAASWNPAGLSQLEKPEFSFAIERFSSRTDTSPGGGYTGGGLSKLNLSDFNYASIVLPVDFGRHVVLSLNYFKKFRFEKEVAVSMFQDFRPMMDLTVDTDYFAEQEGGLSVLAPAAALDLSERLSLGLAVNFWKHSLTGGSLLKKTHFQKTDAVFMGSSFADQRLQRTEFEVTDGISLVLGGMARLSKAWTLGIVVTPPVQLDLRRKEWNNGVLNSSRNAELEFPWVLGLGAAWRPGDAFTASCDVTWTDWSEYRYRDETDVDVNPLDSTGRRLRDAYTVRVGCEYLIIRQNYVFPLRFGLGYDPVPGVGRVDDYFTIHAGAGVQIKDRINLDIGYQYRWGNDVNRGYFTPPDSSEDVRQHRIMLSAIYYF